MNFKEFVNWCNERACDGCWSVNTVVVCIGAINRVRSKPFWKREKVWQEINESEGIVNFFVEPTNKKIKELLAEREETQ